MAPESLREVRLAIWGAGVMGERVAKTVSHIPGVDVVAIIDLNRERAADIAGAVGAAAFTGVAEACAEAGVDAIYIGLPNALHAHACLQAAALGLHVLIDKPLTTTLDDADEVLRAAARTDSFWMMGFSYRFREEWRRAREIVQSGQIGEVYSLTDDVIEAYGSTPAWYWSAQAGGGTLRLQSHHVWDRWEWLLGSPVTAMSVQTVAPTGSDVDLAVSVSARLGAQTAATSSMSFGRGYEAVPRVSFTVQGTLGMIELDETRRLTLSTVDGGREELHADDDWLHTELSEFVAGIRGETLGQPTIDAGRRAVQLTEVALRSAATGQWIDARTEASA